MFNGSEGCPVYFKAFRICINTNSTYQPKFGRSSTENFKLQQPIGSIRYYISVHHFFADIYLTYIFSTYAYICHCQGKYTDICCIQCDQVVFDLLAFSLHNIVLFVIFILVVTLTVTIRHYI